MQEEKPYSRKQQKAFHLGLNLLSEKLNEAGLDQRVVLKPSISIPWTLDSAKNQLFRPIMTAMYGKASTTELSSKELQKVWDVLIREISEKHGVYQEFPNEESLSFKSFTIHPL